VTRYIAFLRAINVGKRVVKMERLRQLFEELGCAKVETFINSGNVIFESRATNEELLGKKIAAHLEKALGYEVGTFLRTDLEIAAIAEYQPFKKDDGTVFISLLAKAPSRKAATELVACRDSLNDFHVDGREAYWLCRASSMLDSGFSGGRIEKILRLSATARNRNTLRRLAAKYPPNEKKASRAAS
jgi:uncharacterized protein (DUF1697 family)